MCLGLSHPFRPVSTQRSDFGISRSWGFVVLGLQGPFDTFVVGGDTSEVTGLRFSNDGKLMLVATTDSRTYVLDAYSGKNVRGAEWDDLAEHAWLLWIFGSGWDESCGPQSISKPTTRNNMRINGGCRSRRKLLSPLALVF